jgi:uncharacterized protein
LPDAECTIDRFWETKSLARNVAAEWEALCDGCGRCCVVKLEDEDTGEVYPTSVSCRLLDTTSCRCTDYCNRHDRVPDCVKLDRDNVSNLGWLPGLAPIAAWRRVAGSTGGIRWCRATPGRWSRPAFRSAAGCLPETEVAEEDLVDFMIEWQGPAAAEGSQKKIIHLCIFSLTAQRCLV